jgi:hypothetical protein
MSIKYKSSSYYLLLMGRSNRDAPKTIQDLQAIATHLPRWKITRSLNVLLRNELMAERAGFYWTTEAGKVLLRAFARNNPNKVGGREDDDIAAIYNAKREREKLRGQARRVK